MNGRMLHTCSGYVVTPLDPRTLVSTQVDGTHQVSVSVCNVFTTVGLDNIVLKLHCDAYDTKDVLQALLVWQETKHKDCRRAQEPSKVHDAYRYVQSSKVAVGRHTW